MTSQKTLQDVCDTFMVYHVDALNALNFEHDQRLMYENEWDYKNPTLLPNKVHAELEQVDLESITDEYDRRCARSILWLWYHHATSCALWRYGDASAAREYVTKAVEMQPDNHPNQITKLLYLLVYEKEEEAQEYAKTIDNEAEQQTAAQLLAKYSEDTFFTTDSK